MLIPEVLIEAFPYSGDLNELYDDRLNRDRDLDQRYMQVCSFSTMTKSMLGISSDDRRKKHSYQSLRLF